MTPLPVVAVEGAYDTIQSHSRVEKRGTHRNMGSHRPGTPHLGGGLYGKMVGTVVAAAPRAVASGHLSNRTLFYVCSSLFLDGAAQA